jgi:hypothetical protein
MMGIYAEIVDKVPQLKRGKVWCWKCQAVRIVNPEECLRSGWPMCCGQTMSIDPPKGAK